MDNQTTLAAEDFEFRGTAREWFGIWIVNILLSIITLGIYSAWAKVRAKKYFYQNTHAGGRNFDYHATGLQILIGRIIVLVAFVIYSVLTTIPPLAIILPLLLIAAIPWLLVRSLRFNAQMSSWSNVRFRFTGTKMGAFLVYIVYPILTALTLYLAYPFLSRAMKRYTLNNHALGAHGLSFNANIGPFYIAFLAAIAWVILATVAIILMVLPGFNADAFLAGDEPPLSFFIAIYAWIFLAIVPAATVYNAMIRNVVFNNLALEGGHHFSSSVAPATLIWIALSNAVVTLFTLGLMLPWAQVRIARYLADHTTFLARGSMDDFTTVVEDNAGALGDAYVDLEGVELGLSV